MPRLNPHTGEYLTGVGGGGGALHIGLGSDARGNTMPIGTSLRPLICSQLGIVDSGEGSGWLFVDRDTIAGQFCGDPTNYDQRFGFTTGCSTWTYNLRTGALGGPIGPGANNGKGRGGTIEFWLATGGYGLYGNKGYKNKIEAITDVFPNGDLLVTEYQNPKNLRVIRGTTVVREIKTVGQIYGGFARVNGIVLWLDSGDGKAHADGAPDPLSYSPHSEHIGPFAADKSGRLWILDGQEGLLIRAWDQPVGFWLSQDEFNFWGDLIAFGDGFRIATSMNQGETPGTTRIFDLDPATGAYTFNGTPGHAPLINLQTGADVNPASLPAPVKPIRQGAGAGADLFPFAVAAGVAGAVYWLNRK